MQPQCVIDMDTARLPIAVLVLSVVAGAVDAQPAPDGGVIVYSAATGVYLASPDGSSRVELVRSAEPVADAALWRARDMTVWTVSHPLIAHLLVRPPGGESRYVDTVRGRNEAFGPVSFGDDPPSMLYSGDGSVKLYKPDDATTVTVALGDRATWLGAGPQFVYETGGRDRDEEIGIHLASVADDSDELIVPYGSHATPSAWGERLACRVRPPGEEARLAVVDIATRAAIQAPGSGAADTPLALAGNGDLVLATRQEGLPPDAERWSLVLFDLLEGSVTVLHGPSGAPYDGCFSPESGYVCFTAQVNGGRRLYLVALDGSGLRELAPDDTQCRSPHWYGPAPGE